MGQKPYHSVILPENVCAKWQCRERALKFPRSHYNFKNNIGAKQKHSGQGFFLRFFFLFCSLGIQYFPLVLTVTLSFCNALRYVCHKLGILISEAKHLEFRLKNRCDLQGDEDKLD